MSAASQHSTFGDAPATTGTTGTQTVSSFGDSPVSSGSPGGAVKPPLPYGLRKPRVAGEDTEAIERYGQQYGQSPPVGYPRAMAGEQGLEELTGASAVGMFGKAATAVPGAFWKTLGQTSKKAATGIATGTTAGYAARKTAQAAGAPEWLADFTGVVAGIWGAGAASRIGEYIGQETGTPSVLKFLKWWRSGQTTPQPTFKPSSATAQKMKYGGPTEAVRGTTGGPVRRVSGTSAAERAAEEEAKSVSEAKSAAKAAAVEAKEAKAAKAELPKPFKPNPRIARQMRYGGPSKPAYNPPHGPPTRRVFGKPSATPESAPEFAKTGPEAGEPSGSATARYKTTEPQPTPGFSSRELNPGKVINTQAEAKNATFAKRFAERGMTPDQVQKMTASEYEQYRQELNVERRKAGLSLFEKVRPGVNRRTFAELKADIIRAMKGSSK